MAHVESMDCHVEDGLWGCHIDFRKEEDRAAIIAILMLLGKKYATGISTGSLSSYNYILTIY